jgi:regulator of RNase E activity RraA
MIRSPLTAHEIEALRRLDACSVANTIEMFACRLRNEGFADASIRCMFPQLPSMVGYAVTVRIRGANPPTGERTYVDRTDWWDYVQTVPEPRVLVVQDAGSKPGLGALLGEVHVSILQALGCVGAVTNGSVRDLPAIHDLGFQMFASGPSVSHAYMHVVEVGSEVVIGGLTVRSADLLHGDLHGVQSIPVNIAGQLPEMAAQQAAADRAIIALCRSSDFTLPKLRAAIAAQP